MVALAAALGMLVPLRLGVGTERPAMAGFAAAVLFVLGARAGRSDRLAGAFGNLVTRRTLSLVVLAVGLALRAVTVLGAAPASGTLPLFGVQVGELTRYLVAGGAALAIAETMGRSGPWVAADRRFRRGAGLLGATALGTLLVLGDFGPAALVVLGVVVAVTHTRGLRVRWVGASLLGVAASVPLAAASTVIRTRVGDVVDPGLQLRAALTAAWSGGLVGPGPGRSPLVDGVPAAGSDYAVAALVADLGAVVVVPVLLGVLVVVAGLVRTAASRSGPEHTVATALGAMVLIQGAWNALGVVAVLPLTGLDAPFLGVNGASLATSAAVVGLVLGVLDRSDTQPPGRPQGARPLAVAAAVGVQSVAVLLVAASLVVATGPHTLGDADQVRMPRGTVWTADGQVVAEDAGAGDERTYPADARYADLGFVRRNDTHRGLEATTADTLTCGGHLGLLDAAASVLHPVCRTADVVTTVDGRAQSAVADSLAGADAEAVLLDAPTGAIRALSSTATRWVGDPSAARGRQGPPGSTMKLVTAAAALMAGVDFGAAPRAAFPDGHGHALGNDAGAMCPASDAATALAYSCNSVFGWAATRVGAGELDRVARTYFGADRPMSVDGLGAPGLDTGLDGRPELDRPDNTHNTAGPDNTASTARTGIGQESVRSSVLGVALATAVVANAGGPPTPWPRLVDAVCAGDGPEVRAPGPALGPGLPPSVAGVVLDGMRAAVRVGTARFLVEPPGRDVAAKTGTAELPDHGLDSWVTVILDHRYVLTLVVHHPAGEGAAVGVANRILPTLPRSFGPPSCPSPRPAKEHDR